MSDRADILRSMQICRFCLDDTGPFYSIYQKDSKQPVPLPLQIMACVAIEVFENDGMPQLICGNCRNQTIQAYAFKTTCKQSDDALKIFLATGNMTKPTKVKPVEFNDNATQKKRPASSDKQITKPEEKKVKADTTQPITSALKSVEDLEKKTDSTTNDVIPTLMYDEIDEIQDEQSDSIEMEDNSKTHSLLTMSQVPTDIYPCGLCERSFPLKQLLELHMKNHNRERNFECGDCGKKFFTKYDLTKHSQTHSSAKPYICVVCNKQFSRETLLHRHEKIHNDVPIYLCTTCDKTFLSADDLDAHSERHKKKRPFVCRICNKCFVFKQGLERHEATHSDEKPHKCNYCEASFTSPIKLTRHITSHAGLRPYPCKLCGRTFLLSHHLTRHMKSHYAAKNQATAPIGEHKCDVCSMSFRRKDSLINHSAIHSMVNLKCVICNTAFQNAKQVKEHITTHLAGLPYPCDKCDYSFETQDQLEEHEVKHAQMEYEEQIEQEVVQEAQAQQDQGDENDDYSGDDIAEFTITCENDTPEVVRRSKRESKIKNYAQFLKDELGSDVEDEIIQHDDTSQEEADNNEETMTLSNETIKPIVRTEGTKVYKRKNLQEKPKVTPEIINFSQIPVAPLEQINQPQYTTLENLGLSKQVVQGLPNKQYVQMKIGDKMLKVQKLIVTKAEMEAMAKEGKIEIQGDILLKTNTLKVDNANTKALTKPITIENIINSSKQNISTSKFLVKKTYAKKCSPKLDTQTEEKPAENSAVIIDSQI